MPRPVGPRGEGKKLPHRRLPHVIAVVVCIAVGACSKSSSNSTPSLLIVTAPVTLQTSLAAVRSSIVGRHPGWQVNFDFLSKMPVSVVTTVTPDVATADDATMAQLVEAGFVDTPHRLAADVLEIAVPGTNPQHIRGLSDLAHPGLRIALAGPATPTGQHAARVLATEGLHLATVAASTPAAALELVATGGADAALVETSDVRSAPPGLAEVPVTPTNLALVTYEVAVVKTSAHRADAQALVNDLLGPVQVALRDHGFLSP